MPEFDLNRFLRELKEDEGVVYRIYPDPIHGAACPTLGVGHLIKRGDKHYGLPLGTAVSHSDVETYLTGDVRAALANARRLYTDFDDLPTEVQLIIANMIFNLGYTGLDNCHPTNIIFLLKPLN